MKRKVKDCKWHEWFFVRPTTELEKKVTRKECYVYCKHCGYVGYCNYKDLTEWNGDDANEKK